MPYSFQVHYATSGQQNFSFAQIDGYVTTDDLSVFVNGVLQSTSGVYTINTTTVNVQFITGRATSDLVVIRRFTDALKADREVDFNDGSILTASDLDNSALQLLYLVQEGLDEAKEFSLRLNDMLTAWDAESKKITNVSTPTVGTDAVNKTYVDSAVFGSISGAANLVLATPNGASGTTTLRALVANDIPTITAAKVSDFDTQVRTSRLDQMAIPTASVSLNSQKITNLLTPTVAADGANKSYVDSVVFNLNPQTTVNAVNNAAAAFKIDIDVNLIEPRRLAQINTVMTISSFATTTHFIRVINSGASAIKYMVMWSEFSWIPLPSGASSVSAPIPVNNLPWNYNSPYYTQGIATISPGNFAYFQGTGTGWTGTADISNSTPIFAGATTGQATVKAWILRLT